MVRPVLQHVTHAKKRVKTTGKKLITLYGHIHYTHRTLSCTVLRTVHTRLCNQTWLSLGYIVTDSLLKCVGKVIPVLYIPAHTTVILMVENKLIQHCRVRNLLGVKKIIILLILQAIATRLASNTNYIFSVWFLSRVHVQLGADLLDQVVTSKLGILVPSLVWFFSWC